MVENGVCGLCGGPRVPGNLGGEDANDGLKEQLVHLKAARRASLGTVFQGLIAIAVVGLGLIHGYYAAFAMIPLFLAMMSRAKASRERKKASEAGERAWRAAAADAAHGGITAKQLAKKLRIAPVQAERLLTASDRVRVDVDDDGPEVVYRSEGEDGDDQAASAHERRR